MWRDFLTHGSGSESGGGNGTLQSSSESVCTAPHHGASLSKLTPNYVTVVDLAQLLASPPSLEWWGIKRGGHGTPIVVVDGGLGYFGASSRVEKSYEAGRRGPSLCICSTTDSSCPLT